MAEIRELQRLYELFKVAKGHIDWIDVMLDWRAGPVDDSFKARAYYFGKYPKKWRAFQFKRFWIA
jgi:hypothetical protein